MTGRENAPPSEDTLAVLVACHHRGSASLEELVRILDLDTPPLPEIDALTDAGHMVAQGGRWSRTHTGRQNLDGILENIEARLAPDDPAYVQRYRRTDPSLPFEANTIWAEAVCVNIAVEPDALRPLVPDAFELDLHGDRGWLSLTASRLKNFGMGVIPRALRMNFYQSTWRAHVTYKDFRGRDMRGCVFVRSDTNSRVMSTVANLLPEFRSHRCGTCPIVMARKDDHQILTVDAEDTAGKVVLALDIASPSRKLPTTSRFADLAAAEDHIVDFVDAFTWDEALREVMILRIERGPWNVRVVPVIDHWLGFLEGGALPAGSAEIDSVFWFRDVPYRWLPLLKEKVSHDDSP